MGEARWGGGGVIFFLRCGGGLGFKFVFQFSPSGREGNDLLKRSNFASRRRLELDGEAVGSIKGL